MSLCCNSRTASGPTCPDDCGSHPHRTGWLPLSSGCTRITATVAGRSGTFLLQDQGTVEGSVVNGDWFVVPGSGTAGLAGLRGEGGFQASLGEGAHVHLDYWFE
jgi:hypothetical protein